MIKRPGLLYVPLKKGDESRRNYAVSKNLYYICVVVLCINRG